MSQDHLHGISNDTNENKDFFSSADDLIIELADPMPFNSDEVLASESLISGSQLSNTHDSNTNDEEDSVVPASLANSSNKSIAQTTAHLPSIIKVIGVGGGGGKAAANMYKENIGDVRYLVCNSDAKALTESPIPNRLQIGSGLGAGGIPEKGRELAEQSIEDIRNIFDDQTKMVFITAGMGGGTGTGAAPIIAREAKAKGILTIGIVTIPFRFERQLRIDIALDGAEQMAAQVDALLVVNNERIRQVYTDLTFQQAFRLADETLTKAVQSIVEVITMRGEKSTNLDFCDIETCLRGGGVAVLSNGTASGENRLTHAIENALNSPLLNDKDVENSRAYRMALFFPPEETGKSMTVEETSEIDAFMARFRKDVDAKFGWVEDPNLTDEVRVTIIASGFRNVDDEEESEKPLSSEEIERQRELDRRRDIAYGETTKTRIRHHRVFLIETADLDNEELIANLDTITAYRRSDNDFRSLRNLSHQSQTIEVHDN